jgi:hypothetical protein
MLVLFIFLFTACVPAKVDGGSSKGDDNNPLEYTTFRWGIVSSELFIPTPGQTTIGDAILQRYKDLEETYNLEIITEAQPLKGGDLTNRLAIQQNVYDFYQTAPRYEGLDKYQLGVLYALEDIETIDADSTKWGYKNFLSAARFSDGKHYGFYPNEWSYGPNVEGILQFNTELIREIGVTNPYEYYERKLWNWDIFTDILQTIKTSGFTDQEIHPWQAVSFNEDAVSIMFANGLEALATDANGNYTFGFDCDAGIQALDFLSELRQRGLYYGGGSYEFTNSKTAVFLSSSSEGATTAPASIDGESIATMVSEYGVITFPYGPNGSPDDVSASVNFSSLYHFIINQSDNTSEDIGLFMEELFKPLDDVPSWQEYLIEDIFQDPDGRDYDAYMYIVEHCNNDFSTYYGESSLTLDGYFADAVRGEMGASEIFESIRPMIQAELGKKTNNIDFDILG